mgnify:CR=1 FL=1
MKPLTIVYWTRFALGILAAVLCVLYGIYVETSTNNWTFFVTGLWIAILIYALSYYIFKMKYWLKIENPAKLKTTGIGIYFITWLTMWILFWTICYPPPLLS